MNMTSWSKWRCVRPNFFFFNNWIFLLEFLPWEIRVAFPGESQLRQSRATQSVVHAGCFSVSVIHRPLTWTTGSLTCTQMLKNANAHGRVRTPWKSLHWKLTLGEKSLAAPGNWTCLSSVPVQHYTDWATSPVLPQEADDTITQSLTTRATVPLPFFQYYSFHDERAITRI